MGLEPGSRLDGYELLKVLGSGGMGEVWLARDVGLGRKVALKLLPQDFTHDERRVARFEQEARAASALSHPNICHVYALGQTATGQRYIAMELVEGVTLRERLQASHLPLADALKIASQIAGAVSAAHAAGIVHRDLKPENVIIRPDGLVKVLDFGLAKLASPAIEAANTESTRTALHTDAGTIVGTIAYMSPEQTRGSEVDARTDTWSLGVMLFEMVSGHRPFDGESSSDVLAAILTQQPDSLARFAPTVPSELQRIVTKALRKDRSQRYQTSSDLLLDLEELHAEIGGLPRSGSAEHRARSRSPSGDSAIVQTPVGPLSSVRRLAGRRLALVAIVVGVGGILGALVWYKSLPQADVPTTVSREPTATSLTANPAELSVTSARISPDGRVLAYADPAGIRLRLIETGETQHIPDTRGMNVYAWSADATAVRASACDGGTCVGWDISLLGGARRRNGATWSEDEVVIATSDGSRLLKVTKNGDMKIDLLNGTSPRRVVLDARAGFVRTAAWSADSRRILYVTEDGSSIKTVPIEGGTSLAVFTAPKDREILDVAELATHDLLAVMVRHGTLLGYSQEMSLHKLHTDAGGMSKGEPRRLTDWRQEGIEQVSSSATGARVAYLSTLFQADVYVGDLDSQATLVRAPRRLTQDDRDDMVSAWMPDNATIVFTSTRNGTADIFTQRIDSDNADPLVVAPGDQVYPQVTSDGQSVLYQDYREPIKTRFMRIPVAGGVPELVSTVPSSSCRCSPRGRCVTVEFGGPSVVVSDFDPVHGKGGELARTPGNLAASNLLPDGDGYAYVLNDDTGRQNRVHVISFKGQPSYDIVVPAAANLHSLDWLSDGSGFFSTEGPVPFEAPYLMTRAVRSKRNSVLFITRDGQSRVVWSPSTLTPQWTLPSRDGKHIAVLTTSTQSNVWMLTNF